LMPLVVVVGAEADSIASAIQTSRAAVVRNPDWLGGLATSLQAGIAAVHSADAVVILLGDQPRVTTRLIEALIARQREQGAEAVVAEQGGRRSPPVLLHRSVWPSLEWLRGDIGARDILATRDGVVALEVTPAMGDLDDVDTPADRARLEQRPAFLFPSSRDQKRMP